MNNIDYGTLSEPLKLNNENLNIISKIPEIYSRKYDTAMKDIFIPSESLQETTCCSQLISAFEIEA